MNTLFRFTILALLVVLLAACAQPTAPTTSTEITPTASQVSFSKDVAPILQSRCVSCHGGGRVEESLDLTSYAKMMAGSKNGAVIVPGDAANSILAQLVINQKMPERGPKLTPSETQLIVDWINQGGLDN